MMGFASTLLTMEVAWRLARRQAKVHLLIKLLCRKEIFIRNGKRNSNQQD
jgi:hypothetical protein